MKNPNVICKHCNWQHFGVTREYAEKSVAEFKSYYDTLSREDQVSHYGGEPASMASYEGCDLCGKNDFRLSTDEEIEQIYGSTISPVIFEAEEIKKAIDKIFPGN